MTTLVLSPDCARCSLYERLCEKHRRENNTQHRRPLTIAPINDNVMVWAPPVCIQKELPFAFMQNVGVNGEELDELEAIGYEDHLPEDWESEVVICANLYLSIDEVFDNE